MSHTNNIISKPVEIINDIASVLGVSSGDLGTLCISTSIKIFSKYKPVRHTSKTELDDTAFTNAHYGISAPLIDDVEDLFSDADWEYRRPGNGYPYRALDFNGYYSDAPVAIFQQAKGTTFSIDFINPISNDFGIPFYVYQKTDGWYKDKDFDATSIYSSTTHGRSALQLQSTLGSEDIIFGDSGSTTLYDSDYPRYLALVAFDASGTYQEDSEVLATNPLVVGSSVRDNDMTVINIQTLARTLGSGTWKLVACAKFTDELGSHYMPAHSFNASYPAKFTLYIADGTNYPASVIGRSTLNEVSTVISTLTTNSWTIYLSVRVYNNTSRSWEFSTTQSDVIGNFAISGTRTTSTATESISRTEMAVRSLPSSATTVAAGGHIDLTFEIGDLWAVAPPERAQVLESGTVTINMSSISYKGITLGVSQSSALIRVEYA